MCIIDPILASKSISFLPTRDVIDLIVMRIFLAPMEGVVDHHMRQIFSKIGGIDCFVTEFIRVSDHVLPNKVFHKYCPELINKDQQTLPTRIQLLGNNSELIAASAKKAVALGAIGIDLNFGCPAKTVNRHRGGACLLDETKILYQIVKSVRQSVPIPIPVTAKIRLGNNDRLSYLDNAIAIEEAGANELFVHARSKADGYKPPAYWNHIGHIRSTLKIPVIANGEIWNVEHYQQCREESGCDDVMIGRGLLARPGLANDIRRNDSRSTTSSLSWNEAATLVLTLFIKNSEAYPARFLGNRVKQWLNYLRLHYTEANTLFEKIKKTRDYDTLYNAILESSQTESAIQT